MGANSALLFLETTMKKLKLARYTILFLIWFFGFLIGLGSVSEYLRK
jgi:preprotein translocase subunit SecG